MKKYMREHEIGQTIISTFSFNDDSVFIKNIIK